VTLPDLALLWTWGLGWNSQYSQFPTVVSTGPRVKMFACPGGVPQGCAPFRIWAAGSERFVAPLNMMAVNISVHADKPLAAVSLWKGRTLYRRFAPDKATPKSFFRTLLLDGEVDKVRKKPSWPRSWAIFSLLWLYPHRNACANLHFLGQPNTLLAPEHRADRGGCRRRQGDHLRAQELEGRESRAHVRKFLLRTNSYEQSKLFVRTFLPASSALLASHNGLC
jgi:hypothetical protein